MGTNRKEISDWFDWRCKEGFRYMLVVVDTFGYETYSVGVPEEIIRETFFKFSKDMQRVMEVYDLDMDKETQLNEKRAWHLPEREV